MVIYFVEQHPKFYAPVRAALASTPRATLVVSALVQAECLVSPMRRGNLALQKRFENLFRKMPTLNFADSIFLDAARLRASSGLKLPDALHLACAQHHGCSEFWTNDHRFGGVGAGLVRVLSP